MDVYGQKWTEMDNVTIIFGPFQSIPVHKRPLRPCAFYTLGILFTSLCRLVHLRLIATHSLLS